jgi:hypothetical protein
VDKVVRKRERHCAAYGHAWKRVAEAERFTASVWHSPMSIVLDVCEACGKRVIGRVALVADSYPKTLIPDVMSRIWELVYGKSPHIRWRIKWF